MKLEDSIIEQLPQIPYVIDQVGSALKWAKEVLDEGEYDTLLNLTYDVTKFTALVSDPNFFKTHYVIATILSLIKNVKSDSRFEEFDSTSKSVEKTLDKILINPSDIENNGCFKSLVLHLIPLAKENMELFALSLLGIKHTLIPILTGMKKAGVKSPITARDYVTILGYALVIANIRMSNISMTNETYKIYNDISIMLNKDLNY